MAGTLMAEGCLQAMTFYLVALGFSRDRNGWRTEPVSETKYSLVCRGQPTPASRELIYELFVDEIGFVGNVAFPFFSRVGDGRTPSGHPARAVTFLGSNVD